MAGVLQPSIQHQRIEGHLVLKERFDRLGHGFQIRQIGNTGLNGIRQRRPGCIGPLRITAKNGQCITTG